MENLQRKAYTPAPQFKPMRYQGRISNWNDEKGYGFVSPNGGGDKAFVHIKEFSTRRRPTDDDQITYEVKKDELNRIRAVAIRFAGDPLPSPRRATPRYFGIILATFFASAVIVLTFMGRSPIPLLLLYAIISCLTFLIYAFDKAAAMNNNRRTRERTLQLLSLVGGWPGALIAQRMFHHKTKKADFQFDFWMCIGINCSLYAWAITERGASFIRALLGTP